MDCFIFFLFCLSLGLVFSVILVWNLVCVYIYIYIYIYEIHIGLHPQKVILYICATRICSTILRHAA